MKKQILSTMMLILTFVIAGFNGNAQTSAVHNTKANPITGTTSPLQPIAGVPYDYISTVSPTGGTANWFVTTNPSFIVNNNLTGDVETKGGNYVLDSRGLTSKPVSTDTSLVQITWNTAGLTEVDYESTTKKPLFVGIMYDAPEDNCANNIQVWKIEPINGFTLDITNVDNTFTSQSYGTNVVQCFDEVVSAAYNFDSNEVKMDYGTQTLYFEVIAANFSNKFNATFKLDGLQTGQEAKVFWGYTPASTTTEIVKTGETYGSIEAVTNETNTSEGVSIYVKVEIQNKTYDGVNDQTVTLSIDGTDAAGNIDVTPDLNPEDAFADVASQTITARPAITNPVPSPFEPKN